MNKNLNFDFHWNTIKCNWFQTDGLSIGKLRRWPLLEYTHHAPEYATMDAASTIPNNGIQNITKSFEDRLHDLAACRGFSQFQLAPLWTVVSLCLYRYPRSSTIVVKTVSTFAIRDRQAKPQIQQHRKRKQ